MPLNSINNKSKYDLKYKKIKEDVSNCLLYISSGIFKLLFEGDSGSRWQHRGILGSPPPIDVMNLQLNMEQLPLEKQRKLKMVWMTLMHYANERRPIANQVKVGT